MEHANVHNVGGSRQEHIDSSGGQTEPLMSVGVSETDFAATKVDNTRAIEASDVTENQLHLLSPEVTGLSKPPSSEAPPVTNIPAALCQSAGDDKPQRYSHTLIEQNNNLTSGPKQGAQSGDLRRVSSTATTASVTGSPSEEPDSDPGTICSDGRPNILRDLSTQTVIGPSLESYASPPTSQATASRDRVGQGRPTYPNQSFATLQSQLYLPPNQIQSARNRSSHSTHISSQSSGNLATTKDFVNTMPTAKTVGNTPVQSPGLFSPTTSPRSACVDDEDTHHGTPLLHATYLQAPKE